MDSKTCGLIDHRSAELPSFPGLIAFSLNPSRTLSAVASGSGYNASEAASVRSVLLLITVGLLPPQHHRLLLYHVMQCAGYYQEKFSKEQLENWIKITDQFIEAYKVVFTNTEYPKFHAMSHIDTVIQDFGSYRNLDEMSWEKTHQYSKKDGKHSKRENLVTTVVNKVNFVIRANLQKCRALTT